MILLGTLMAKETGFLIEILLLAWQMGLVDILKLEQGGMGSIGEKWITTHGPII